MNCVPLAEDPREIVRRHLAEAASGWSVGTWGAIGEFQYDDGEPGLVVDLDAGAPHVDMMVRIDQDDAAARAALREGVGRSLLEADNPAGAAIARASPTRVFLSA